jgi:hypothetical protein
MLFVYVDGGLLYFGLESTTSANLFVDLIELLLHFVGLESVTST